MLPTAIGPRSWHCHSLPLIAALAAVSLATACQKSVVAPGQSKITLASANSVISVDGSTTITATVLDSSGNAVQDATLVNFETTLGTMQPAQSRTKQAHATSVLTGARQPGTASVIALSGNNTSDPLSVTIVGPLGVTITPQPTTAAVNVSVSFTVTVTPATGGPGIDHFTWDFGDSKTATTSTGSTNHVYATAGPMVVKVTATALDGSSPVGQIEIIITSS
jgi:trimeric autotransporter adhesin